MAGVIVHQSIILPVNTWALCGGSQSICEGWSPDVSNCRRVQNYSVHGQHLADDVEPLGGKLQFSAVGVGAFAAESPG